MRLVKRIWISDLQLDSVAARIASEGRVVGRESIAAGVMLAQHVSEPSLAMGVGWGGICHFITQYHLADSFGPVEPANNAYNLFVDLFGKTGLLGLSCLLLSHWVGGGVRVYESTIFHCEKFQGVDFSGCMLLGIFFVHAMLEHSSVLSAFLLFAGLLLADRALQSRLAVFLSVTEGMSRIVSAVSGLLLCPRTYS
ncbi:hypothetical protein ACTMU2_23265 [Cupriavidus basilensis]